jgi:hypothetical protein
MHRILTELQPENMNSHVRFCHSKSWKPLISLQKCTCREATASARCEQFKSRPPPPTPLPCWPSVDIPTVSSPKLHQCFHCLRTAVVCYCSALKMEATRSSRTSHRATCHIPEDSVLLLIVLVWGWSIGKCIKEIKCHWIGLVHCT